MKDSKNNDFEITKMKHREKLEVILAVENGITTICFTILAVAFNEWWIIIIGFLLFRFYEHVDKNLKNKK